MSRELGPQEDCVQCGESKSAIKESQRRRDPIFCARVDYEGEVSEDWERHRFIWTEADEQAEAAEVAFWESIAAFFEENEAKEAEEAKP